MYIFPADAFLWVFLARMLIVFLWLTSAPAKTRELLWSQTELWAAHLYIQGAPFEPKLWNEFRSLAQGVKGLHVSTYCA
jgi:hypothetical protein